MGYYDADGFYHYEEPDITDTGSGFSGLLNKSTNALPNAIRARVTADLADNEVVDDAVTTAVAARRLVEYVDYPGTVPGVPALAPLYPDGSWGALATDEYGRPHESIRHLYVEALAGPFGDALGVETRHDVALPDVAAIWAWEDDSIAFVVRTDGTTTATPSTPSVNLTAGDSITEATNVPPEQRWTTRLSARIGKPLVKWGRSGARSAEISWYLGAVTSTGIPAGGTIPASGTVTITGLDVDPWRADSYRTVPVMAMTDDGTVIAGTMGRTGTTRVFTRTIPGPAVATARVQFRAVDVPNVNILFLGMGVNDEPLLVSGETTVDDIIANYQAVLSRHDGPVVVWAMLDRGPAEAAGTVIGDAIRKLEAWARATVGDGWCPMRRYLASPQALTDAARLRPGFTPTAADLAAQAVDTIPPSFRDSATSVHPNELGNLLMSEYFTRHVILRGLV